MTKKNKNTPGLGAEYEVLVPAHFALVLNNKEDVENFLIRSNVEDLGNMDDLVIDITMENGENVTFCFQLTHKDSDHTNLVPGNFEGSGKFSLKKYCSTFKILQDEYKNYHFILYSNRKFDGAKTKKVTNFDMSKTDICSGNKLTDFDMSTIGNVLFNTSGSLDNVYKFAVNQNTHDEETVKKEDFQAFFKRFWLYTNQKRFNELEESIKEILKSEEVYLKYEKFFRNWHNEHFTNKTIDKKTLNLHLIDMFLSSYTITSYHLSNGQKQNLELFEQAVGKFDITVIDDLGNFKEELVECEVSEYLNLCHEKFRNQIEDFMTLYKMKIMDQCLLRLAKEYKFFGKSRTELDEETKLKILFYLFEKPILLDFNKTSKNLIYKAMDLYHETTKNKIKFVVLGLDVDVKKFSKYRVFQNLKDLSKINSGLYRNVLENSSISLQGRENISLKQLIEFYEEIVEFTTVTEIFLMLKSNYLIGEDKEDLSQYYYIPRSVWVTVVDVKTALNHCKKTKDLLMIDFGGTFKIYSQMLKKYSIINISSVQNTSQENHLQNVNVVKVEEEYSKEDFLQICQQNPNRQIHYLKIFSKNSLMLIMSSKNTFLHKNYTFQKLCVHEEVIHSECNGPVNILCAQPGMGKSTLFKSFKNQCPPNIWVLFVDLKCHNSYLKEEHDSLELLNYFMKMENQNDTFLKKLKKFLLEQGKILFLLDGLDEIENICIQNTLNHVEELSSMGHRFWLSTRQNLQQRIENYFNIFSTEITELNEEQQKLYVRSRLGLKYQEKEIEKTIPKIFINIANNRQIVGIPLQLKIITELFLDDKSYNQELNDNIFVLSKMYKCFFEGRYRHAIEKQNSENPHLTIGCLADLLEKYEIAALLTLFNKDVISELKLDIRETQKFLERIKDGKDLLGIIVKVNAENQAVFEHMTFAEYFAAVYLAKNFDKTKILLRLLFSEEHQNLFLILNILLAEDNNLHLAVIYKDIEQIRKYIKDGIKLDRGGRNVLHLSTIHSVRLPALEYTYAHGHNLYHVNQYSQDDCEVDITAKAQEIIEYLVKSLKVDPLEKDQVLSLNTFEYALESGSLYIVERILNECQYSANVNDILWTYFDEVNVVYYSMKFGYPKLLELGLAKRGSLINIFTKTRNYVGSILGFVNLPKCRHKAEIINVLVKTYETKRQKNEYTVSELFVGSLNSYLYEASKEGNINIIKLLIDKGADLKAQDMFGANSLAYAARGGHLDAVNLLIEKGATYDATIIYHAVHGRNIKLIEKFLNEGFDINMVIDRECNLTPLYMALIQKSTSVVEFLLERGAKYDQDILCEAVYQKNTKIIEDCLKQGCDINAQNTSGATPLLKAVQQKSTSIVEFLLKKGAKFDQNILCEAVYQKDTKMIEDCLKQDCDINAQNIYSVSPLLIAVQEKSTSIVELLLKKGAKFDQKILFVAVSQKDTKIIEDCLKDDCDINAQNIHGATPLFIAVEKKSTSVVEFLLERGAKYDQNVLCEAVSQKNTKMIEDCLKQGCDINAKGKYGTTPLFTAVRIGSTSVVEFLLERGAKYDQNILCEAVYQKNTKIIEDCLTQGCDINAKNENGATPLEIAIRSTFCDDSTDVIQFLLSKGAECTSKTLHYAAGQGSVKVLEIILNQEVDINEEDENGATPLFKAVDSRNAGVIKFLWDKGARCDAKMVMWAAKRENIEAVVNFLKDGFYINEIDEESATLLHKAAQSSNVEAECYQFDNPTKRLKMQENNFN